MQTKNKRFLRSNCLKIYVFSNDRVIRDISQQFVQIDFLLLVKGKKEEFDLKSGPAFMNLNIRDR